MLKTTLAASSVASAEVKNEKQDGKGIQVDRSEKKSTLKSYKSQSKGQKWLNSKSGSKRKK